MGKHWAVSILLATSIALNSSASDGSEDSSILDVTQFVVNGIWSADENDGVDLDVPRLLTRPAGIDKWTEDKRRKCLGDNSYDLSVDINNGGVWLHAVETNLTVVPNGRWQEPDLSWVRITLQSGKESNPLVFWELPRNTFPITFAFRTGSGRPGLLRVMSASQEERTALLAVRLMPGRFEE